MWAIVRRAVVPVLLLILALLAIVAGLRFHPIAVLADVVEEREMQKTIDVPLLLPPGLPMGDPSSPDGPPAPDAMPFGGPTSVKEVVTYFDKVTVVKPVKVWEPELTRAVTVGGVVRLASGALKRPSSSGKGPAVCPT
jgi:hypothetical protein